MAVKRTRAVKKKAPERGLFKGLELTLVLINPLL